MKKNFICILCVVSMLLGLCGCGGKDRGDVVETGTPGLPSNSPEVVETKEPEGSKQPQESEPVVTEPPVEEEPGPRNPLTGMPIEEEKINDRPVAIMLNNIKAALPQQGNGQADIIYEVVTEGGITRMLGIYQSVEGIERLASVRSSRPAYIEMALGHDAVYIHAGGSEDAYQKMSEWDIDHLDGVRGIYSYPDNGLFWRERDRVPGKTLALEHSLVTSGEAILNVLAKGNLRVEHNEDYIYEMAFEKDGTPENGENASKIKVPFSAVKTGVFLYDEKNGTYLAEQYGEAYIDGNTGEQVSVTNVLILQTTIREVGDSKGHTDPELIGGNGWFACGGKISPITWEKGDRNNQFRYFTADGEPLALGCGKSYVNIISIKNQISYE